jgi:hypothetical protein
MTNFPIDCIKGALLLAGVKDVRYYLNGLHFLPSRIEAANGAAAMQIVYPSDAPEQGVIVPRPVIENALKIAPKGVKTLAVGFAACTFGGLPFTPVDAKYPDVSRVIPTAPPVEGAPHVQADPELVLRVYKAVKLASGAPVLLQEPHPSQVVYRVGPVVAVAQALNERAACFSEVKYDVERFG